MTKPAGGTAGVKPIPHLQSIVLPTLAVAGIAGVVIGAIAAVKVLQRRLAVKTLLNAGANVNAVDNAGNTPLHFLAAGRPMKGKGSVFIARMLVKAGGDITIENAAGYTPYKVAKRNYRIRLLRLLRPKRR